MSTLRRFNVTAGTVIDEAIQEGIDLARITGRPHVFRHNTIDVIVNKDSCPLATKRLWFRTKPAEDGGVIPTIGPCAPEKKDA